MASAGGGTIASLLTSADFLTARGLRPDPFQARAMAAIDRGLSVVVAAPTGAGKTLVADYAIERALADGRTAIYTSPLKALSNQKYRDLAEQLGDDHVGLLTGDRSVNPRAPVVVMTTEVLRALLYDRAPMLRDLALVVLDEFHYLQDPGRGPVWEEVVIETPSDIALVCLSATVGDVNGLVDWLAHAHGPATAIVEDARPVPLEMLYAVGNLHGAPALVLPMFVDGAVNPVAELHDGVRRETRGQGLRVRDRGRAVAPTREQLLDVFSRGVLLPAIWFVLSRAGCDHAVEECVTRGVRLTSVAEAAQLRALVDEAGMALAPAERRALRWGTWSAALEAGVASHHGGLIPLQRELVEHAYAAALVKVAFATETLALGVNLPARTVVVDSVARPDGHGRATISATEFAQLAGRAGRRGLDAAGHVVVPWAEEIAFHQVAALAGGRLPELESHFVPTASMVSNLLHRHDPETARRHCRLSLAQHVREREATRVRAEIATLEAEVRDAATTPAVPAPPAGAPRGRLPTLGDITTGDVIVDPGRTQHGALAVVDVRRARGGGVALHTVRADCRRVVMTARDFRMQPVVVARLDLSAVGAGRGHARHVAELLAVAAPAPPTQAPRPLRARRARYAGRSVSSGALARQVDQMRTRLADLEDGVDGEFDAMVRLLRERGHLDGWTLTPRGVMLRRLFHRRGLLVAECLAAGFLDGLDAPDLAALVSVFLDERLTTANGLGRMPNRLLQERWHGVVEIATGLGHAQAHAGLVVDEPPTATWSAGVHRWANGADLDEAMAAGRVAAGDLVRVVRQVADLLEQIGAAAPLLRATTTHAIAAVMRAAVVAELPSRPRDPVDVLDT